MVTMETGTQPSATAISKSKSITRIPVYAGCMESILASLAKTLLLSGPRLKA